MQATKEYPTSSGALFSVITRLFINNYEEHTGVELKAEEVKKGIEYFMTFGKNNENESKVILNQYEVPKVYEIEIISNRGTTMMRYELFEQLDNKTVVTYTEATKFPDMFSKINHRLLYMFMKKKLLTRMEQNLDYIYKASIEINEKRVKENVI